MTFWSWFAGVFAKGFFDFLKSMIDDVRNQQTQQQLGAEKQKNSDLQATAKAKEVANSEGLKPADVDQTIKELEDGTF